MSIDKSIRVSKPMTAKEEGLLRLGYAVFNQYRARGRMPIKSPKAVSDAFDTVMSLYDHEQRERENGPCNHN